MSERPSSSKVSLDWPLTDHQRRVAADFILNPPPSANEQRAYVAAWDIQIEYEELKAGRGPAGKRKQRQYVRALLKRERQLVSAPRRAAAPSRMEIHRAALRYLRHCGGVDEFNISAFVRYVQTKPTAQRRYGSGKSRRLKDHAIRAILKQRLGIVGKPGRKRDS